MINRLARIKIYLQRTSNYMSLSNFFVLTLFALTNLFHFTLRWWQAALLLPCILVFLAILGWAEDRLGVLREEQRTYFQRVPQIDDILERLNHIEKLVHKEAHVERPV